MDRWINLFMDGLMNEHKDEQAGGWTGGLMDRKTWINGCMDRSTDTWMIDGHMDDRRMGKWMGEKE